MQWVGPPCILSKITLQKMFPGAVIIDLPVIRHRHAAFSEFVDYASIARAAGIEGSMNSRPSKGFPGARRNPDRARQCAARIPHPAMRPFELW
jgi:hypothetical protein